MINQLSYIGFRLSDYVLSPVNFRLKYSFRTKSVYTSIFRSHLSFSSS